MTYQCVKNWCTSRGLDDVDALVVGLVLGRLKDPEVVRRLREKPDTAPVLRELEELRRRRDDIAGMVADGLLDGLGARPRLQDLAARIAALEGRLSALRAKSPGTDIALVKSIPRRWKKLSVLDKRRILAELGITVTVKKSIEGKRSFDPSAIDIRWAFEQEDDAA